MGFAALNPFYGLFTSRAFCSNCTNSSLKLVFELFEILEKYHRIVLQIEMKFGASLCDIDWNLTLTVSKASFKKDIWSFVRQIYNHVFGHSNRFKNSVRNSFIASILINTLCLHTAFVSGSFYRIQYISKFRTLGID